MLIELPVFLPLSSHHFQFRSMQLASSLLGVLVLQVKPQLERLLRLPADSLTKEIALSQVPVFLSHLSHPSLRT